MSENRPYDIFISYRRHGGAEYVRPLKAELELRGYNVFLDYDELKDGVFDKRIMDAIEQAPIFVFMLSAHSLDRCVNDDDWVRKEIEFAVSKKRHFVPVNPNKEFDGFPDNVPEQVKQSLGQHQFSHIDFEQLFKASVTEMVVNRIQPVLSRRTSEKTQSGKGAMIRIDTDLDCRILRFGKEVGTAVSGELSEIRLPKGKHKLSFVGLECEEDCTEQLLDVDDLDYEDYIEIRLLDKYNARRAREAAARKAREEAERKAREEAARKAREEAERRAREEAKRRAREEAERKAREEAARKAREEAERRARKEAARKASEEAARKACEEAERRHLLGIYAVGDYYNDGVREGVVFEVSADGKHGKIVSMKQSTQLLQWAINERKFGLFKSEAERLIGADSETDGAANMAKVKAISGWEAKYPAFKWCADLGEGWYLPSIEELKTFTLNDAVHDAVNRTLTARGGTKLYNRGESEWYWSSTENDYKYSSGEFCACYVYMDNGNTDRSLKFSNHYVRAVATFGEDVLEDDVCAFVEKERKARVEAERKAREEAERRRRLGIYRVGDYYNDGVREGVVFEVSADCRHGKIVSMKQAKLQWSSDSAEQNRLIGADSETDGAANMAKVKAISGWRDKYPAFKWCADLGEGWYLPAIDELKTFTLNEAVHDAVNRTLIARGGTWLYDMDEGKDYWSSTEKNEQYDGAFSAWNVRMSRSGTIGSRKYYGTYVRAVATFEEDILEDDVRAFVEKERKAREEAERKAREEAEQRRRLGIYRVGDYYNDGVREGVVFEVSADGRHGKIVSMKQSAEMLQWATNERKFGLFKSEAERLIGADSKTDGAYNMAKVMARPDWQSKYPAFKWCADLGEDWYLPSIEELKVFTLNTAVHEAVNRTLCARGGTKLYDRKGCCWYWSSTEDDMHGLLYFCAWHVDVKNDSSSLDKDCHYYVRAVSAF